MKMAIYIASTGSLVDKAIDIWTGLHGYSHCEIVFDHIESSDDDTWLCCSSSPRDGELRFNRIDIYSRHWHVVDIPEINTVEQEQTVYDQLKKMEGAKYDWKGIFLFFIFRFVKKQDDKKWWCSEICAYVLNQYVKSDLCYRISPNKLARFLKAPKQPFKFMFSFTKSY